MIPSIDHLAPEDHTLLVMAVVGERLESFDEIFHRTPFYRIAIHIENRLRQIELDKKRLAEMKAERK